MPTAIWSWQMRSGSSHCDLQLATMKHEEYEEEEEKEKDEDEEKHPRHSDKI